MPRTSTSNNGNATNVVANTIMGMNDESNNNILQPQDNNVTLNASSVVKSSSENIATGNSVPAKTPILKMSVTRRQRRSNKRSGQRLPSSNYLVQMGQRKTDEDDDETESDDDEWCTRSHNNIVNFEQETKKIFNSKQSLAGTKCWQCGIPMFLDKNTMSWTPGLKKPVWVCKSRKHNKCSILYCGYCYNMKKKM